MLSKPDVVRYVDGTYPHATVLSDGSWAAEERPVLAPAVRPTSPSSTVVVLSSDAPYYPGLIVALTSFKRYHPDVHAVVLDCGLTTMQSRFVAQFAEVRPGGLHVPQFPAWARFEVACLPYERVLYLDSDIVVLSSLESLLSTDAEFAAVRNLDWTVRDNFRSLDVLRRNGLDPDAPAFNAGVFVLDNRVWGGGRLLSEALAVWPQIRESSIYPDQSTLHAVLCRHGSITWLDPTYNAIAEFWDWTSGPPHVVHFAGDEIKPWHPGCTYPGLEWFFAYSKIATGGTATTGCR
jgi:Glycosyl transferase family 8